MTGLGELDGRPGSLGLGPEPGLQYAGGGPQQVADLLHVLIKAHDNRRSPQLGTGLRRHQLACPRADPHDRQPAACLAPHDGNGGGRALALWHQQLAPLGQGSSFRDARGSDGLADYLAGMRDVDGRERGGGVDSQGDAEPSCCLDETRLVGLRLDGGYLTDGAFGKPVAGQRRSDEVEQFIGRDAPAGSYAETQARRAQQHAGLRRGQVGPVGDQDRRPGGGELRHPIDGEGG